MLIKSVMQPTVCTILDERHENKRDALLRLSSELSQHGVRVLPVPGTSALLKSLNAIGPDVLVLDYLLGDFGTGLDLLEAVNELASPPRVFFLTDEPSTSVAVSAMKLGAEDYLELSLSNSVTQLVSGILSVLRNRAAPAKERPAPALSLAQLSELTSNPLLNAAYTAVRCEAEQPCTVLIISGAAGSGKRALARAAYAARQESAPLIEVDLRSCTSEWSDILGVDTHGQRTASRHALGEGLSLYAANVENDDGALLQTIRSCLRRETTRGLIAVGSRDPAVCAAWRDALGGALLVNLPGLAQRREDTALIVRHLVTQVARRMHIKCEQPSAAAVAELNSVELTENLHDLRSIVARAVALHRSERLPIDQALRRAADVASALRSDSSRGRQLDPYLAALTLDRAGGSMRIAAARLGASLHELTHALHAAAHQRGTDE